MVHYPLLLVNGYLYGTLLSSTGPLDISMVHHPLILAHRLSLWHTPIFYWPIGYLCGTLPLIIPMIHCYTSTGHWISLWYTVISYWLTGYPYVTLLFSTCPLDISMVHSLFAIGPLAIPVLHCYFLLVNWISLLYTTLIYWPTGYLNGTRSFPIGPLAISMVHYYLLLAYWLSIWNTSSLA